jgi:hypothetical protein
MRDRFDIGLLYRFGKREYVHIQPAWSRYYTQSGEFSGSGKQYSWELGHLIRTEYPDLKVRVTGVHAGFNSAANAVLAVPGNVNIYGLCIDAGETYRNSYSQSWRPSLDLCATHNDLSGRGYNAGLGLVGSVAGHDQLSLGWRQESGGVNIVNGLSRELRLSYRYFY